MLHSQSHMLLTRIALDCLAAALRERIYALPDVGTYGIPIPWERDPRLMRILIASFGE
jgi:hypothetical protein